MLDQRIDLRSPWIAGILAFLVPGAGHAYQRRYFKAGIYSVCILGLFWWGMLLGDWKVVYAQFKSAPGRPRTLGYWAQLGVGLPAMPALVQAYRFESAVGEDPFGAEPDRMLNSLDDELDAPFVGDVRSLGDSREAVIRVRGTIHLEPAEEPYGWGVTGRFVGTDEKGNAVELELGSPFAIGPRLRAARRRKVRCAVLEDGHERGTLEGTIPRPLVNWFQMPLDRKLLADWHRELGKQVELAQVFTWIAGLLNILAIWDAVQGPAYGYGDEWLRPAAAGEGGTPGGP
ncbi:MAG: hypothetical protein D6725_15635 [Planctomycetota bacterium]|nr:MAG: hypothetical protein D6725_15635 [Planctomycetota bacterium]